MFARAWKWSLLFSFLQPLMFLTAMGIGVGGLMDRQKVTVEGLSYLAFLAPGVLASTCMQVGTFDSTFPILSRIMWDRSYEAMLATPMRIRDLVVGEFGWTTLHLTFVAGAFLAVIYAFGIPTSLLGVLALPAGVLTGLTMAAAIFAFTATRSRGDSFNAIFRFVVTPMLLFSGAVFPVDRLPAAIQPLVYLTPLFHGVRLTRGLILDRIDVGGVLLHTGVLLAMFGIGTIFAYRNLNKRLVK